MIDTSIAKGQCLCGKVELHTSYRSVHVGACHCTTCRKWGGAPYMEVNCGTDVTFVGEEFVKVFDSSEWAERGFCSSCGSHLFYRLKGSQEHMVSVGLFDDSESFVFDNQVFIDEKPGFYSFAEETKNMTGAELFDKFAPEAD